MWQRCCSCPEVSTNAVLCLGQCDPRQPESRKPTRHEEHGVLWDYGWAEWQEGDIKRQRVSERENIFPIVWRHEAVGKRWSCDVFQRPWLPCRIWLSQDISWIAQACYIGQSSCCIWCFRENIHSCKYLICVWSLQGSGGYNVIPWHWLEVQVLFPTGWGTCFIGQLAKANYLGNMWTFRLFSKMGWISGDEKSLSPSSQMVVENHKCTSVVSGIWEKRTISQPKKQVEFAQTPFYLQTNLCPCGWHSKPWADTLVCNSVSPRNSRKTRATEGRVSEVKQDRCKSTTNVALKQNSYLEREFGDWMLTGRSQEP